MPVRVGPGQGLVPPVDGVDVAVDAVVVGARPRAGRAAVLQTLCVRFRQRLQPREKNLEIGNNDNLCTNTKLSDGHNANKKTNIAFMIIGCILQIFTLELPSGDTLETLVSLLLVTPSSLWVLLASSWK